MEFDEDDYLINIKTLKVKLYDELMQISPDGSVSCEFEEILKEQFRLIKLIEKYGEKMGG